MWRTNALRVAVVGAGIGGLAVASGLQRAGAEVIVLEQAARFLPKGAGLSLFSNGLRAARALGLGDALGAITADANLSIPVGTRTTDGTRVRTFPASMTSDLRVVDRSELHQALLQTLAPDTVRPGIRVEGLSRGVLDLGPSGQLTDAHVIVGADGLRSRVRGSHAGDPGPAYCGYGAWRGITSEPVELTDAGETFGRGERFGYMPLRDGRVYWFAVRPTESEDGRPEHAELLRRYADWHAPIATIIGATNPRRIGYQPIERLAHPLRTYARADAVLVGDAAHAMPPTLGQGANLALEDAAVLVSLLTPLASDPDQRDVPRRLAAYDRARRPRTQRIARQALVLGEVGQWDRRLGSSARTMAMRMAPDVVVNRMTRQILDWQPPQ